MIVKRVPPRTMVATRGGTLLVFVDCSGPSSVCADVLHERGV